MVAVNTFSNLQSGHTHIKHNETVNLQHSRPDYILVDKATFDTGGQFSRNIENHIEIRYIANKTVDDHLPICWSMKMARDTMEKHHRGKHIFTRNG